MPKPMAICIEDTGAGPERGLRFLRCVALPGRQPGLRLGAGGQVLWRDDREVACELWVSADDRLILFRPEGAAPAVLHRSGRSLEAPFGKPVVVVDGDEIDVGARRLRVHVHGEAPAVAPPSAFEPERSTLGRVARAAAAALVIGSGVAAGGCKEKGIDVRDRPPEPGPVPIDVRDRPPEVAAPEAPKGEATEGREAPPEIEVRQAPPKIEVRETPPDVL